MRRERFNKQIFNDRVVRHGGFYLDFEKREFYRGGSSPVLYTTAEEMGTFTRGGTNHYYVDKDGILVNGSADQIRYSYEPATFPTFRGALFESASTNECLESQTFDSATWVKNNSSVNTDVVVAPDGTTTADELVEDATAGVRHTLTQTISFTTGRAYTFSVWVKANTRSIVYITLPASAFTVETGRYFVLSSGTVGGAIGVPNSNQIEAYANGWYRISISETSTATTSGDVTLGITSTNGTAAYNGDGSSSVYVWGAQLEFNFTGTSSGPPSSYMPTVGSTASRSADTFTFTPDVGEINTLEGACFADIWQSGIGSPNIALFWTTGNGLPVRVTGGIPSMSDSTNAIGLGGSGGPRTKIIATSWGAGGISLALKGVSFSSFPTNIDFGTSSFDFSMGTGPTPANGAYISSVTGTTHTGDIYIRKMWYRNKSLGRSELSAIVAERLFSL